MQAKPSPEGHGKFVLIIGPSGVGKSVILKILREKYPEIHFPKSATTRARRAGESLDLYHFVSDEEFDRLHAEGKLLEWAQVHGGARYATISDEIVPFIERGKIVLREVDVQGFDSIRSHPLFAGEHAPYALQSIFILPESTQQLVKHITQRAPIAEEELARRVSSMETELKYADHCDVRIVNEEGKLDQTIEMIEEAVFGE